MVAALGSEHEAELLNSASELLATNAEATLLAQLREELEDDLAEVPAHEELVGDIRLLRSLRAFDHDVHEAASRFRQHLAMRQQMGLDAMRDRVLMDVGGHDHLWNLTCDMIPHSAEVNRYMPEVPVFARSASGDPVCLGIWGQDGPQGFIRDVDGWRDKFVQYFLYLSEARALLADKVSRDEGRLAHFVQVLDLENWSMLANLDRAWAAYSTEVTLPLGETYHDFNSFFICVRAGRLVPAAWATSKRLLPKKVTEKVVILGGRFFDSAQARDILGASTLELLIRRNHSAIASRRPSETGDIDGERSATLPCPDPSEVEDSKPMGGESPIHDAPQFPLLAVAVAFAAILFSLALAFRM